MKNILIMFILAVGIFAAVIYLQNFAGEHLDTQSSFTPKKVNLDELARQSIPEQVAMLTHANKLIANRASQLLVARGKPAVEPLLQTVTTDEVTLAREAANVLAQMGKIGYEPLLAILFDSKQKQELRLIALQALGRVKDLPIVARLMPVLGVADKKIRKRAISILGYMGRNIAGAVEIITPACLHRHPRVQKETISIIKTLGPKSQPAISSLILLVNQDSLDVKNVAADALIHLSSSTPAVVKQLAQTAQDIHPKVRMRAIRILGCMKEQAAPAVNAIVRDYTRDERLSFANAGTALRTLYKYIPQAIDAELQKVLRTDISTLAKERIARLLKEVRQNHK